VRVAEGGEQPGVLSIFLFAGPGVFRGGGVGDGKLWAVDARPDKPGPGGKDNS
jgi:hypothetical protein